MFVVRVYVPMLLVRVLKPSVGRAGRIADMRGSVIRQEGGVLLRYVARGIFSELTGTKGISVTGKHKVPVQPWFLAPEEQQQTGQN